jgi:C-terminal processing protease CtpA/Prc
MKPMASKKSQNRNFNGMSYRQIQGANAQNRQKLNSTDQKWLKENGYKNFGWDHVIPLYQKIEELLDRSKYDEMSLEELFLEADRIGNKYLTPEEITEFNQQLSQEVQEIGELIDRQFPDTEIEVIDYSQHLPKKVQKRRNQKTYRTTKL